jgi:hypothetical protein
MAQQISFGKFKADRYDKIQKIISTCEHDMRVGNQLSENEISFCKKFIRNEAIAELSYKNFIEACAFKKLQQDSKNNKSYYNQQFVDFLAKRGKLGLMESKNQQDKVELEHLVQQALAETQKKEFPAFVNNCEKSLSYVNYYNNYLLAGKYPS